MPEIHVHSIYVNPYSNRIDDTVSYIYEVARKYGVEVREVAFPKLDVKDLARASLKKGTSNVILIYVKGSPNVLSLIVPKTIASNVLRELVVGLLRDSLSARIVRRKILVEGA